MTVLDLPPGAYFGTAPDIGAFESEGGTPPNQAPTASYTWSATDLTVDFTDTSTDGDGTVTGWAWDFGDGATSIEQSPQHTFAAAADYTVTLSVTDDDGAASTTPASQTISPAAPNQAPTASYTWSATDLTVDFTDTSTDGDGTVAGWAWDFGDGATSTAQSPQHTYAGGGDYTVTLSVTDDDGAASATPASQTVSVAVAAEVTISEISPSSVALGSTNAATITGSGFATGATVTFESGTAGPPPEVADAVVVVDSGEITFTLTTKSGGPKRDRLWDVRVSNPDGSTAVLVQGLVITP
jgi:PKD repeat protein